MALTLLPLKEKTPEWAARMTRFSLRHAIQYNQLELRIEDEKALRTGRPYVVGEWLSKHNAELAYSSYASRGNLQMCSSRANICVNAPVPGQLAHDTLKHLDSLFCSDTLQSVTC